MNHITILSINYIDEQISIIFDSEWFQEDIKELQLLLLNRIPNHDVRETTVGADRENIRFRYLTAEFLLNFDYYSQSCWVSAQDELSKIHMKPLFDLLIRK
jgi:hypothetical protein